MNPLFKSILIPLMVLLPLCLRAQEKTLAYYDSHESEILPDAQAAFRKGDYGRTLELCRWHFIIVGDDSANALQNRADRCSKLTDEMNQLRESGQVKEAKQKASAILSLNPNDAAAKAVLLLEDSAIPVLEQDTVKVEAPLISSEQPDVSEPIQSYSPNPVSIHTQKGKNNNWFVGIGGGLNFSRDGQTYYVVTNGGKGVGTAVDVYIGKWFKVFAGFRVGYQGLSTSNQYTSYGKNRFDYGHADLLIRVRNWLIPYVHVGYTHIDYGGIAGGLGLMTPIHVTRRIAIVPDVKFLAHSSDLFYAGPSRFANTISGTLGVAFNLGSIRKSVKTNEPITSR